MRAERGGRWHGARIYRVLGILLAEIANIPADPLQVWTSGDRITEQEYHALLKAAHEPKPF